MSGMRSALVWHGLCLYAGQVLVEAEPLALNADVRLSDAFKCAIHACIRQFRLNEALLVENRDPRALHQARVAVRRMRSAFSIFRPIWP